MVSCILVALSEAMPVSAKILCSLPVYEKGRTDERRTDAVLDNAKEREKESKRKKARERERGENTNKLNIYISRRMKIE